MVLPQSITVLNYFGINDKYFKYVLDDSLMKQNKFIPETNIQLNQKIVWKLINMTTY